MNITRENMHTRKMIFMSWEIIHIFFKNEIWSYCIHCKRGGKLPSGCVFQPRGLPHGGPTTLFASFTHHPSPTPSPPPFIPSLYSRLSGTTAQEWVGNGIPPLYTHRLSHNITPSFHPSSFNPSFHNFLPP